MITYDNGSIFDCGATAIVNAVNCVGVMGAGLAKAFADRYPLMEKDYIEYCNNGLLRPGKIHTYYSSLGNDPIIVNLPTKDNWINPSKYTYIDNGMEKLASFVANFKLHSVAVPALGCGLGGLEWGSVKLGIEYWAETVPDTHWIVFPPQ